MAKPKPLSRDQIQSIAAGAARDAIDFVEAEIVPKRKTAQKYFNGESDLAYEEGRSKLVATKCRDTIRQLMPSLMRVFLHSDAPVEFVPTGPEDVAQAEQATRYVNWKFREMGGYRLIYGAFFDALVKRNGILKVYWEEDKKVAIYTMEGIDDQVFVDLMDDPGVELLEHEQEVEESVDPQTGQPVQVVRHDVKIAYTKDEGDLVIEPVPPEEFFIDRNARSLEDAYCHGQQFDLRKGDLYAMGFTEQELDGLGQITVGTEQSQEDEERKGWMREDEESEQDPSTQLVTITEVYMRLDVDGTGKPLLHRLILGGEGYKLLDYDLVDESPYAVFLADPEPHSPWGRSLVEMLISDQDAATSMLRGILDNVHMTNNPRLGILENQVNIKDAMNGEIGALVRMKVPGAIMPIDVPFTAGQTIPMLQYLDEMTDVKSGVSRASMGLDPDALQSTTRAAVAATVQAAAAQMEMIARNLAEYGMRDLFSKMLKIMVKYVREGTMMRLGNAWVPVDPRVWNSSMDLSVNVGLGTGREEEKAAALDATIQIQQGILQAYGPTNGLVTLTGFRNALADRLAMAGIRNVDRYYQPMDSQTEAALMEQKAQEAANQPQQQDPSSALVVAEQIKQQTRQQEIAQRGQLDFAKLQIEDDRERDRMAQDMALKVADIIGRYGIQVDTARIKAEQAMPRPFNGPPTAAVQPSGPEGMQQ